MTGSLCNISFLLIVERLGSSLPYRINSVGSEFLKNHNIKKKEDFDYSWFKNGEGKSGSRQIIRAAHLEEVEIDIDNELNQFSHGKLSIFDFHNDKEGWNLMTRFGYRMNAICFRLFDYLRCSYTCWIGNLHISKSLNQQFDLFKDIFIRQVIIDNVGI